MMEIRCLGQPPDVGPGVEGVEKNGRACKVSANSRTVDCTVLPPGTCPGGGERRRDSPRSRKPLFPVLPPVKIPTPGPLALAQSPADTLGAPLLKLHARDTLTSPLTPPSRGPPAFLSTIPLLV